MKGPKLTTKTAKPIDLIEDLAINTDKTGKLFI
jgi:hypothetical protein